MASYLIGLVAFLIYIGLFLLLLRIKEHPGWLYLEILTGLALNVLSSIVGLIWVRDFSYFYSTSLFAFLWFCSFFVTSIYSVSVSVGVVRYLYRQPDYSASIESVYRVCIIAPFSERSEFLVKNKQVQNNNGSYEITTSGMKTVHYLMLIQKILGMESQGFYAQPSGGSTSVK